MKAITAVLLVEDNPGDADLIRAQFSGEFEVEHADRLATGLKRLALGGIDVVLLDLSLPDSHGLATLHAAHSQAGDVPIVVLTGLDDETVAMEALQQGAQDYLVKGVLDGNLLARSLRYAIERARTQKRLRESNQLIQQIVDILYFYDVRQRRLVYGSRHFAGLLGLKSEEMQQARPSLPDELLHPEDVEAFNEHVSRLLAAKDQDIIKGEFRIKAADGDWRWLAVRETVFTRNTSGGPVLILGSAQDITERQRLAGEVRKLEEKLNQMFAERSFEDESGRLSYRELYDNAPDMMALIDMREGTILQCNQTLANTIGKDKEDLIGQSHFDLYAPGFREAAQEAFAEFRQTGRFSSTEQILRRADGSSFHVLMQSAAIHNDAGEIVASCCTWRDITERKQADDAMAKLIRDLGRSNEELERFAYIASHDLKEPLRKVQAFADRLETVCGNQLGDRGRDYLERVQSAAKRMQTLITELLQFSTAMNRRQSFTSVNLKSVVGEILKDLEITLQECGARVEVGELPTLHADPIQMRLLVQNLVGNALKFRRGDSPPVIRIHGRARAAGNGENGRRTESSKLYEIIVQDNGIGFDGKYSDRIFGPFQRLHNHLEYEGTGLGLALCRKIAEGHGGTIAASSEPGNGATFVVTLPAEGGGRDGPHE